MTNRKKIYTIIGIIVPANTSRSVVVTGREHRKRGVYKKAKFDGRPAQIRGRPWGTLL